MEIVQWILVGIGILIVSLPILKKIQLALADDGKIDKEEAIEIGIEILEVIEDKL